MKRILHITAVLTLLLAVIGAGAARATAQEDFKIDDFSLQVTPSPIVETIKPGAATTLELKIRNTGSNEETLRVGLSAFTVNSDSGEVTLDNKPPIDVADWVTFANPVFTVPKDEWYTQKVTIAVPESAGFSYAFAITIDRNEAVKPDAGETAIQGSVAVFALLTVDKPGAERTLSIDSFSTAKKMYEYLPADFSVKFKNKGNVIVQPAGTIFIQRPGASEPIATLPVNATGAYLLPDTVRTVSASWEEGFPVFKTIKSADNTPAERKLQWDFSKANQLRFGKYEARLVAVYNDGERDIPVTAVVEFMVVPWKFLAIAGVVVVILAIGIGTIIRKVYKVAKRKKHGGSFGHNA